MELLFVIVVCDVCMKIITYIGITLLSHDLNNINVLLLIFL